MSLLLIIPLFIALIIAVPLLRKRNLYFPQLYRFSREANLLTPGEQKFCTALNEHFGVSYYIFPQVHLDHLVHYRIKGTSHHGPFHHIDLKHVDFVLCDKTTYKPALVIELDEATHTEQQLAEDRMVEDLLNDAHIPFIRIKYTQPLNISLISEKVHDFLAAEST